MLRPFGKLYGLLMDLRNGLYDRGTFASHQLGARTISIGNLTTGGTGKTPLTALIAETLLKHGEKVCILSRGYGRSEPKRRVLVSDGERVFVNAAEGGDEPVELARRLNGKAVVIADADRVSAAKWALSKFDISVFLLDDGFQHRRAKRDLDIVCIDATDPCGNGRLLPAGKLRESFKGLKRADAVVITRTDLVGDVTDLIERLRKYNSKAHIFRTSVRLNKLRSISETSNVLDDSSVIGKFFAFCGVGNPDAFFEQLKAASFRITGTKAFADHHRYSIQDPSAIEAQAKLAGAEALATTAKDAVKLEGMSFSMPVYAVTADIEMDEPDVFLRLITSSPEALSYLPNKML